MYISFQHLGASSSSRRLPYLLFSSLFVLLLLLAYQFVCILSSSFPTISIDLNHPEFSFLSWTSSSSPFDIYQN
uniref:Ovule protein n=1 Tax=Caenorhabditis tropicalis TaxID=1561998 RepID=A0A1I7UIS7_9PELO